MLKNSAQQGSNTIDVGEAHSYIVSVDNTWNNVDDQTCLDRHEIKSLLFGDIMSAYIPS